MTNRKAHDLDAMGMLCLPMPSTNSRVDIGASLVLYSSGRPHVILLKCINAFIYTPLQNIIPVFIHYFGLESHLDVFIYSVTWAYFCTSLFG